ncbi:MAG: glycosyltransferase family 4 protein [Thermoplasmata archaeon]|nr:glycosyltransferase family 4 protein [Thermoplasmata archaeon]
MAEVERNPVERRFVMYVPNSNLNPFHARSPWLMLPRSFHELGYRSTLICGRMSGGLPPQVRVVETGLVVNDPRRGGALRSLVEPWLAFGEIRRQQPDLVIVGPLRSSLFSLLPLVGLYRLLRRRGRSSRTRFVLKADWNLDPTGLSPLEFALSRTLLVASTHVLDLVSIETSCGVGRAQALPLLRRERLKRIPLGFPQGTMERVPYEHGPRGPVILCVARIARMKGQAILLQAFEQLAAQFPEWSVRLVGPVDDPAYRDELLAFAAEHGLANRVVIAGFLDQAEVDREFTRASVFCLPSIHSETAGQVKYEATGFGIPVVTTDVPCGPDAIEMGWWVAPAGDASDLARQLRGLLGDASERQRVAHGAQSKLRSYRELAEAYLLASRATTVEV